MGGVAYDNSVAQFVDRDVPCDHCGYNLKGLSEHRCPECGNPFVLAALIDSRVPWVRRDGASLPEAYARTVAAFVLSPRKAAQELCRPGRIDSTAARAFRNITVAVAILSLLSPFWILALRDVIRAGEPYAILLAILFTLVAAPSMLAFFAWMTLLPTEVSDEWNLAVHCYAFSPLALMSVAAVVCLVGMVVNSPLLLTGSLLIVIGSCIAWWYVSSVCLSVAARSKSHVLWSHLLVMFPLQWLVGLILAAGVALATGMFVGSLMAIMIG